MGQRLLLLPQLMLLHWGHLMLLLNYKFKTEFNKWKIMKICIIELKPISSFMRYSLNHYLTFIYPEGTPSNPGVGSAPANAGCAAWLIFCTARSCSNARKGARHIGQLLACKMAICVWKLDVTYINYVLIFSISNFIVHTWNLRLSAQV